MNNERLQALAAQLERTLSLDRALYGAAFEDSLRDVFTRLAALASAAQPSAPEAATLEAIANGEFESLPALADKLERAALSFESMAGQARDGVYVSMDEWYAKRDALRAVSQRVRAALAASQSDRRAYSALFV